ncbi:MAG: hypothetical protein H7245_16870 [Candidatus Saccharibacteria bacterium]|nr:hypothetical protein [Pseudorhodobacter sp.]
MNDTLAQEVDRMDAMLAVVQRTAAARPAPEQAAPVPDAVQDVATVAATAFDTHRLLADIASASTADFPAALTRAARAVMDRPALLILQIPGEEAFFIGAPEGVAFDDTLARRLFAQLDGFWVTALIENSALGLDGPGQMLVRAQTRAKGHDLKFAVMAFCEDANDGASDDLACRLDVLAAVTRIWVDRFGEDLASQAADA